MPDTTKQHWDSWEKYEKLKMSTLKRIYLDQRVMSTFIIELWAKQYGKPFKEGVSRYNDLYAHVNGQWKDYLFSEYGSIDLSEILPSQDDSTPPAGDVK